MKSSQRIYHILSLFVLFICTLISTVFCSFINVKTDGSIDIPIGKNDRIAVCELHDSDSKITKFTDLTTAINRAKAKETIYVYPELKNSDNSLYQIELFSCTLVGNLVLPYDSANLTSPTSRAGVETDFADKDASSVSSNRKTIVVLQENQEFVIGRGATLTIGGVIGAAGGTLEGQTSGAYAELSLKANSKITNRGTIDLFGYIKEFDYEDNGSKLINESGSRVKAPLVVYDFSGGSYTVLKCYDMVAKKIKICPFNVFDFPNIKCFVRYEYNSFLDGYADLYASSQHNLTVGSVLGPVNALLLVSPNSYVECKYRSNGTNYQFTQKTIKSYSDLSLYGNISLGYLSLSVSVFGNITANIKTSDTFMPISYKYRISCYGNIQVPYQIKFLNGSYLYVSPGAKVTFGSDAYFYCHTWDDIKKSDGTTNEPKAGKYLLGSAITTAGYERAFVQFDGAVTIKGASCGYFDTSSATSSLGLSSVSASPVEYNDDGNDIYTETDYAMGCIDNSMSYTNLQAGYFYVGKAGTASNYYWYVGDEVRGNLKYARYKDGVLDSSFAQTNAYDITINGYADLLVPENIEGYVFNNYSYLDKDGNVVELEQDVATLSGADIVPNVTNVNGTYELQVRLNYIKAYKTTITYYSYDGRTELGTQIVINGFTSELKVDVVSYVLSDDYVESNTSLNKKYYAFSGWENMGDSSAKYMLNETGKIIYDAPKSESDLTLNLKALHSDTYTTETYYKVSIDNTKVKYTSEVDKRRFIYGINFNSSDVFNNISNPGFASSENEGLSKGSYIFFIKDSATITITLRQGYNGLFNKTSVTMIVIVGSEAPYECKGEIASITSYPLTINGSEISISGKAS